LAAQQRRKRPTSPDTVIADKLSRLSTAQLRVFGELQARSQSVKTLTNVALGIIYQMSKHFALMASGGPGVESPAQSGQAAFYASIQYTN
jgi:hypothetical protein